MAILLAVGQGEEPLALLGIPHACGDIEILGHAIGASDIDAVVAVSGKCAW